MKKKNIFLLVVSLLCACLVFVACDGSGAPTEKELNPLATPFVSISDDGIASWSAIEHASGYTYKINNGPEKNTASLSVQLSHGQSFTVKAVGDGVNYKDSAYSSVQTYVDPSNPTPVPIVLSVPTVTISASGVASWNAVAGASGYKYTINGGAEQTASGTFVTLTNGQTIAVKAVGDGVDYTDSAYSEGKTYTASQQPPAGNVPQYLGIRASSAEPKAADGVPDGLSSVRSKTVLKEMQYRSFDDALATYYAGGANTEGEASPQKSNYDLYAKAGETVYVQIWLNNPSQHTILSLFLNTTKYQVGGGLSSFFVNRGGVVYNCVYVAVPIQEDAYDFIRYEVSQIEYVSGAFINQDGTDTFMNENDTVSIGLPFSGTMPSIAGFEGRTVTVNSYTATVTLTDADDWKGKSGGWLRVVLYDDYNVLGHKKLTTGTNAISFDGLVEKMRYTVIVYLYADLHDGNGVKAHVIARDWVETAEAITVNKIEGDVTYLESEDRHCAKIDVSTTLNSASASYLKLEILDETKQTVVYSNENFNGTETVTKNILNASVYYVRVYYKDTEYPEGKYIEEHVYVVALGQGWLSRLTYYPLYDDLIVNFTVDNNDNNYPYVASFVLNVYDENSPQYIAESVLFLLDNPSYFEDKDTQLDLLREQQSNTERGSEEYIAIYEQIQAIEEEVRSLEYAKWAWENRNDHNKDKAYWQAQALKGKNMYTFTFTRDQNTQISKIGRTYYAYLKDYFALPDYGGAKFELTAQIDRNEGKGLEQEVYDSDLSPRSRYWFNGVDVQNIKYTEGLLTYDLFNTDDYDEDGEYYTSNKGYIYKVEIVGRGEDEWEEKTYTVYTNANPAYDVDEDAWYAEYMDCIKTGKDWKGLVMKHIGEYPKGMQITLSKPSLKVGDWRLRIYTRAHGNEYEEDEYFRMIEQPIEVTATLDKPTVTFEENRVIVSVANAQSHNYIVYASVKDKTGALILENQQLSEDYRMPSVGSQIQVMVKGRNESWKDSAWSDWTTFEGVHINQPIVVYDEQKGFATWEGVENAGSYKYSINGGAEVTFTGRTLQVPVSAGDKLKIKAVVASGVDAMWVDSFYTEWTCTDAREKLSTPQNVKVAEDGVSIAWDPLDNGATYQVLRVDTGEVFEVFGRRFMQVNSGASYQVRAVHQSGEFAPSAWSDPVTYTGTANKG